MPSSPLLQVAAGVADLLGSLGPPARETWLELVKRPDEVGRTFDRVLTDVNGLSVGHANADRLAERPGGER